MVPRVEACFGLKMTLLRLVTTAGNYPVLFSAPRLTRLNLELVVPFPLWYCAFEGVACLPATLDCFLCGLTLLFMVR